MSHARVHVPVGASGYDVLVGAGLLDRLGTLLADIAPAARYAVIADDTVAALLGERVLAGARAVAPAELFTFPAGEASKTRRHWADLTDRMLAAGVGRDGAVLALGGGVTGDLAGFVAATFHRGIPCVQLPTTMLAMIDSAVGGKTGVDTPLGKNLVGAFHQPRAVLADVATLPSLPVAHLAGGLAEALKHGAILDAAYFTWLTTVGRELLAADPGRLEEAIRRSVELKAGVVAQDEREAGPRAMLNFGHTIGHAVEAVTEYTTPHGAAVAMGMVAEAALGARLGITDGDAEQRIRDAVAGFDLPADLPSTEANALYDAMRLDKKARRGTVRFALIEHIGQYHRTNSEEWTVPVPAKVIRESLAAR